jgi:hypothetical protein|tara:strand:- start:1406 stop:1642 length:237 start_codon:yes stop_codon:yes gene_type:complete
MRGFRHQRLVQGINARDYGVLVVFYPLNIRYATDSTNMQMLAPGVSMRSLSKNDHRLNENYQAQKYGCMVWVCAMNGP